MCSFQNPIENGQHTNSTLTDVKIMNQRSHILYEQLKGFVQRMDMNVVKKDLPPKTVFVITVKLSPLQRKLYKRFLDVHGFTTQVHPEMLRKRCFFAGYQALARVSMPLRNLVVSSQFKCLSNISVSIYYNYNNLLKELRKPRCFSLQFFVGCFIDLGKTLKIQ